ncbi:undecaprenyl-phosphate glucose phosphotransferase [Pseudoalteromonas sp. MMG010]|uniref:undecaprenyl-phosphate glucose phosphotransferase n=1 Tax=Pseudoalteromonas sp. MMG010 TaxID=2822685 RepID=UPI001B39D1AA|nr:undecaprenyl-phosphate glucose phosphotransferase [Pseudoalteromonas sp. MMG010]MBQ4834135.1 undecaprenyl-phosphate glucose phosphotransferase [Pseudoalteromonas sp. MMG010]
MRHDHMFEQKQSLSSLVYRLLDAVIIFFSLLLAAQFYGATLSSEHFTFFLIVLLSFFYIAEAFTLYRSWRAGKFRHMVINAWITFFLAFIVLFILAFIFKFTAQLSRIMFSFWFFNTIIGLFTWRVLSQLYKLNRRRLGLSIQKVAVIGATESGVKTFNEINKHAELGFECVGFFDDRKPDRLFQSSALNLAGRIELAVKLAKDSKINVLFIALPFKAENRIQDIITRLGDTTVDVHYVPDFFLSNLMQSRVDHLGDMNTLSVFESPHRGIKELIKRTEDILIGGCILVLIFPLLILISLLVKLTSKGPIFFKQMRYGLNGETINIYKFRSMTVMENNENVQQATKNDKRITPFGRFLRRTSLDELPQFLNVIKGNMSIVGPRPHAISHNETYRKQVSFYMLRHKVKPGITGWAQINGWRGETDTLEKMNNRVIHDLHYIKHWSLWFDIKIILLTILKGFINKNAY